VGNSPTNATDPTGLTIERSEIGDDIGEFLKGNRQHRHIYTTKLGWLDSSHFKMDQIYRTIYNQLKAIHKSGKPGVVTAVYGGTPGTTTMKWDVSPKGERFSLGDPCNGGFADSYLDVVTFGLAYELFVIVARGEISASHRWWSAKTANRGSRLWRSRFALVTELGWEIGAVKSPRSEGATSLRDLTDGSNTSRGPSSNVFSSP